MEAAVQSYNLGGFQTDLSRILFKSTLRGLLRHSLQAQPTDRDQFTIGRNAGTEDFAAGLHWSIAEQRSGLSKPHFDESTKASDLFNLGSVIASPNVDLGPGSRSSRSSRQVSRCTICCLDLDILD